jgi:asparagine synthase (glutamine-hydrolysing)
MCGIAGIYAFTDEGKRYFSNIDAATETLRNRGPDARGVYKGNKVALGHTRLSIIDVSTAANQPLKDVSGRYTIIANSEIYNYKSHRNNLLKKGVPLKTKSDTEIILYLYIR